MPEFVIRFITDAPYNNAEMESILDDVKTVVMENDGDTIEDSFTMEGFDVEADKSRQRKLIEELLSASKVTLTVEVENDDIGLGWGITLSENSDEI